MIGLIAAHIVLYALTQCGQVGMVIAQNHDETFAIVQSEEDLSKLSELLTKGREGVDYELRYFESTNQEACVSA